MKKFFALFAVPLFITYAMTDSFAAMDVGYSIDVEQNFSYLGGFDLNDDGNNPIATRGDVGPASATSDVTTAIGASSGETVRWFDTLLGFNGTAKVPGWEGNDVIFHVRLVSQFDWLGGQTGSDLNARPSSLGIAAGPYRTGGNVFDLSLNQAYVKMEEFLGLPWDLTVGRQNLWLGKGFVLGSRILGHGPTIYAGGLAPSGSAQQGNQSRSGRNGQVNRGQVGNLPIGSSSGGMNHAPQYADFTGFDAVKVEFDWNRWSFNGGYALVASALTQATGPGGRVNANPNAQVRDVASDNDEDLVFANVRFDSLKRATHPWNLEAYWIMNTDREPMLDQQPGGQGPASTNVDRVYTSGLRGDIDFRNKWGFNNIGLFAELADQCGILGSAQPDSAKDRERDAWAVNAGADFNFKGPYTPWFGVEFVHFSGPGVGSIESDNGVIDVSSAIEWTAWDPVFRGKHFSMILDFLDVFYLTDTLAPDSGSIVVNQGRVDSAVTNRILYIVDTGFSPSDKVDMSAKFIWAQMSQYAANEQTSRNLGSEVDVHIGYKVSSKLQWMVDGGIFFPSGYYEVPVTNDGHGRLDAWIARTGFKFTL